VLHLGYAGNDIAFFRNLQDSGQKFRFVFGIYPGEEQEELTKNVGAAGLMNVFSYVPPSAYNYAPNFGPTLEQFREMWDKALLPGVAFGANAVYGYMTGLVIERALATTESLDQMAIHNAVFALSGKLKTMDGTFAVDDMGAQTGEITPLGQLQDDGKGGLKLVVVYPPDLVNGKPIIGK
jgi:branched-chain amino acid transport system substrate-binding protein